MLAVAPKQCLETGAPGSMLGVESCGPIGLVELVSVAIWLLVREGAADRACRNMSVGSDSSLHPVTQIASCSVDKL